MGRTEGSAAPVHALDGDEETLLELPPAELVRFGLVSNQGLVLVGVLLALINRFVDVDWGEVDWTGFVWQLRSAWKRRRQPMAGG